MVVAAHDWNKKPSELGICEPEEDLAMMLEYTTSVAKMTSYDAEQAKREAERKGKK